METLHHGDFCRIERHPDLSSLSAGTRVMRVHESPAQVRMPELAHPRLWTVLQGPCWCLGAPGESSSFGLSRHRSVELPGFDRHVVVVSSRVLDGSLPTLRRLYAETPDPKLIVAVASCPAAEEFWEGVGGSWTPIEEIVDVDTVVNECISGRPESLLAAVLGQLGAVPGLVPLLPTPERVES